MAVVANGRLFLRLWRVALPILVLLASNSSRPTFGDEQVVVGPRGSLSVHPAGRSLQIVEWIGPGSTALAWPSIDQRRYAILSMRVVPTGLPQVGLIAALTPTWGLDLAGVPLADGDLSFIVKRCRSLGLLRLRHSSALSEDEFNDLTDDERAALKDRTLSGDGLAKIERLKRLTTLEITGYTLPATRLQFLAELKELRMLAVCDMPVTDDDLRSLANLPNLARLDLSGTAVTGSGLRHLCNCPSLNCVILNRAPITKEIETTLKEHPLSHLQQLHVSGCKLAQDRMVALRNAVPMFASVVETDGTLQSVAKAEPPAPRNAQDLRSYRAICQMLMGFDTASVRATGKTVTALSLDSEGWMPAGDWVLPYLSAFGGLKHLWLRKCRLSVDALEQLQAHNQLEWLDLNNSSVDDAGVGKLAGMKQLKGLALGKTKLTDASLKSLSQLPNLEALYVEGTQVTDRGLREFQFNWHLKNVDFKKCAITDEGAKLLSSIPTLEFVRIDDTQITDRGLRALANLPRLRALSCVNCKITDEGAEKLLRAENLAYCQLEGTSVSKSLQTSLAKHVSEVRTTAPNQFGSASSTSQSSDTDPLTRESGTSSTRAD
jgi:internalin A